MLTNLKKLDYVDEVFATNYYSEIDPELCIGCETCVSRCQMEAITVEMLASQAAKVDDDIWNGANATAGEIGDGFIVQFAADGSVIKANNGIVPSGNAITESTCRFFGIFRISLILSRSIFNKIQLPIFCSSAARTIFSEARLTSLGYH